MSAHDLIEFLHKRPFIPFRIHVDDGTTYDVYHPELVVPGISSLIVGIPPAGVSKPRYYETWEIVSMGHVTRLQPLEHAPMAN